MPCPILPAIKENHLYFIFFLFYWILVKWGYLGLILGFVNAFHSLEQEATAMALVEIRETNLRYAFAALDRSRQGYLVYAEVEPLLKEIYSSFESLAKPPDYHERMELVRDLDADLDGRITCEDFTTIDKKCFGTAVKALRSKTHFERYFSASNSSVTSAMSSPNNEKGAANAYSKMTLWQILLLPAPISWQDVIDRLARVVDSVFYDVLMDSTFFGLGE